MPSGRWPQVPTGCAANAAAQTARPQPEPRRGGHPCSGQPLQPGRRRRHSGYLLGADALISADLLRELAAEAKLRPLLPAGSPVEKGYRPSRALADFVRARDLTCRAPGCDRPATVCQLDHTVPFQDGGVTHASNIKCLCMVHHLIKTFWGWKDRQLPDGTVIWTIPDGQTYVTTPAVLCCSRPLRNPTGSLPKPTARRPSWVATAPP